MPRRPDVRAEHLPRALVQKLIRRAAEGERAIVVTTRRGKFSKVYSLDAYLKMRQLPGTVKPWQHRKGNGPAAVDPLGAVEGTVHGPISRQDIYEE